MRRRPRLVGFLWRWHRRLGLFAALLALMLAVTGISLNHSSQLAMDQRFVESGWLYRLYGEKPLQLVAYPVGERWLFRSPAGKVYLDAVEVAPCRGDLVGGQVSSGLVYVACEDELLLVTEEGELVESITASLGLPGRLMSVGLVEETLALQFQSGWRLADLDSLSFDTALPEGSIIQQRAPGVLPEELSASIPVHDNWLSWERLVLDLHSGRLGGSAGVFLVDVAGIIFCLLGFSGVIMWWLHRRGGRRH